MACVSCGSGLHWECEEDPCCCKNNTSVAKEVDDDDDRRHPRRWSRDSSLKDQQSTGRKRAAKLYPIDKESPCEWQGLLFAGGGYFPIVGCINGRQRARHHGPDKNTLNNEQGNVHRICDYCHNRWHAKNDDGYEERVGKSGFGRRHDSNTKATPEDQGKNEIYWAGKKLRQVKD